jgi:hypothetical protein
VQAPPTQQTFILDPSWQSQTGEIAQTFNLSLTAPDESDNPIVVNIGTPVNPTVNPDGTPFDTQLAPYCYLCSVEIQGVIPTPGIQCVMYANAEYASAAAEGYALQILTSFLSALQALTPGNYTLNGLDQLSATPSPPSPMVAELITQPGQP